MWVFSHAKARLALICLWAYDQLAWVTLVLFMYSSLLIATTSLGQSLICLRDWIVVICSGVATCLIPWLSLRMQRRYPMDGTSVYWAGWRVPRPYGTEGSYGITILAAWRRCHITLLNEWINTTVCSYFTMHVYWLDIWTDLLSFERYLFAMVGPACGHTYRRCVDA